MKRYRHFDTIASLLLEVWLFLSDATVAHYSSGVGQIWLDDVQCHGTENRLLDCPHPPLGVHNCNHNEDVGIQCQMSDPLPGMQFQIRAINAFYFLLPFSL